MKDIPSAPTKLDEIAHVSETSELVEDEDVILEDLNIKAQKCGTANAWAELISKNVFSEDSNWQKIFKERFVVLPDSTFNFLTETGTEVHTRIKINERTKTVDSGALWFEESLPSETILVGVVQCNRVFSSNGTDCTAEGLIEEFATKPLSLQIGGKATVGRGQMRCLFTCP